ncbi:hypothetical protein CHS0354_011662 [Potamilus streckersoni]|uniref:G-protein coupled receptors family 1 profile domain-containing protein n=1 Tax=Potamilus streckersoni TaxID=2493646 RepID=A0AAE0WGJ7_9BIVA|nr:hypothetical protein CHS0354_011662 [Potamilus streckersoni]
MEIFVGEVFTHCTEFWDSPLARRTYDFAILFIICVFPAVIVLISYVLMGKRLWETDAQLCGGKGNNSSMNGSLDDKKGRRDGGVIANRRRLAKMCITVSVVFILCWTPYYTMNIYLDYQHDVDTADMLHYTLLIGHLHCITNPIMYCFLHKTFRHYVERYLSCGKKIRNPFATAGTFTRDRASKMWQSFRSTVRSSSRRSLKKSTSSTRSTCNSHTPKTDIRDIKEHECSSASNKENVPLNGSYKNTKCKRVRLIIKKIDGQNRKYPASLRVVQIPDVIKEESKTNSI